MLGSGSDSLHRCYCVDVELTLSVGPHCCCESFCPGRREAFLEVNVHQYLTWFNPPGCRGSGCGTMNQGLLPFKKSSYGNLGSAHQEPLLLEKGGQTLAAECCDVAAGGTSQCLWTVFLGSIWEPWVWGREGQWAPRCAGGGGLDVKKGQGSSLRRWKEEGGQRKEPAPEPGLSLRGLEAMGGFESRTWVVFLTCCQMTCGCLFTATVVIILNVKGIKKKL